MALSRELFAALNGNNTPPSTEPTLPPPTAPMPIGGETPAEKTARLLKEKLMAATSKGGNKVATIASKASQDDVADFMDKYTGNADVWQSSMDKHGGNTPRLSKSGVMGGEAATDLKDTQEQIRGSNKFLWDVSRNVMRKAKQLGMTKKEDLIANKDMLMKEAHKELSPSMDYDNAAPSYYLNKNGANNSKTTNDFFNATARMYDEAVKTESQSKATPPTKNDMVKK